MEIKHEIDLVRSPAVVFDFLVDTSNFPRTDPALIEYSPHEPLRIGLRGTFAHRRGGLTARTSWHVVELQAPDLLQVALRGMGYEMVETVRLAAAGTGTHATFVERVWPTSLLGRVMVALAGGIMRRDLGLRSAKLQALVADLPAEFPIPPSAAA
jgi:hypothetical protein